MQVIRGVIQRHVTRRVQHLVRIRAFLQADEVDAGNSAERFQRFQAHGASAVNHMGKVVHHMRANQIRARRTTPDHADIQLVVVGQEFGKLFDLVGVGFQIRDRSAHGIRRGGKNAGQADKGAMPVIRRYLATDLHGANAFKTAAESHLLLGFASHFKIAQKIIVVINKEREYTSASIALFQKLSVNAKVNAPIIPAIILPIGLFVNLSKSLTIIQNKNVIVIPALIADMELISIGISLREEKANMEKKAPIT